MKKDIKRYKKCMRRIKNEEEYCFYHKETVVCAECWRDFERPKSNKIGTVFCSRICKKKYLNNPRKRSKEMKRISDGIEFKCGKCNRIHPSHYRAIGRDCDSTNVHDAYYCNASYSENDKTAPKITWMEVHAFMDGAFVEVDTNEPTNASVDFYKNDSYCSNVSNSIRVYDWKLNNSFTSDDYDFWHDFSVENTSGYLVAEAYEIESNVTYYFKIRLCDKKGNCALSACTDFTTVTNSSEYRVGFDLPATGSNVSEMMGKMEVQFDWARDGDFEDRIDGLEGFRVNDTKGRDVDLKFFNPNSSLPWGIDFKGVDFVKAQDLNITDAFVVNTSADGDSFVGMDGDNWEMMAQTLGVDEVEIIIPQVLDDPDNAVLMHCPDNITNVSVAQGCKELNLTDVNCTFGEDNTTCVVPTSIGFSVFGVVETVDDPVVLPVDPVSPGGGSGGAAGGAAAVVANDTVVDEAVSDVTNDDTVSPADDKVSLGDELDKGSSFWFWFPLVLVVLLAGAVVVYFVKFKK